MCAIDYCDTNFTVLSDEDRTARKPHKCCECGRVINPGEKYNYQAGVGDGFDTFKTCQHCQVARDLILKKCRGFVYQEIRDDLREHFYTDWGKLAARLYVGMNRQWKRFQTDALMPVPMEVA